MNFKAYLIYLMCMNAFICKYECAPVSECLACRGWRTALHPLEHARIVNKDHCILHHCQTRYRFARVTLKKRSNTRCRDGLPCSPRLQNFSDLEQSQLWKEAVLRIKGSEPQHVGISARHGQPQRLPSWKHTRFWGIALWNNVELGPRVALSRC